MDKEHEQYLKEFFDELTRFGFKPKSLPNRVIDWLNELANKDLTPKQAAQIVWFRLNVREHEETDGSSNSGRHTTRH